MTISVCMGIYNGEKYIEEQLYSILHQTRQPDEVILCDDISQDNTVKIVRDFIKRNRLQDSWRLFVNQENKGYPSNFYYAMSLCTGDIVFLSDQDDIWNKKKLERMEAVLQRYPSAKALCCKFSLIDAAGKKLHTVMKPTKSSGNGTVRQITIEDVFYKSQWPGMVLAYRREWFKISRGAKQYSMPHDFLVCAAAAEENGFFQLDEELACHRRHDNNTGGEEHRLARLLNKKRKMKEIEEYIRILEAFEKEKILGKEWGKQALEQKLVSMQGRYAALKSGKVGRVLRSAMENRGKVRLMTVICDVLIVGQKA